MKRIHGFAVGLAMAMALAACGGGGGGNSGGGTADGGSGGVPPPTTGVPALTLSVRINDQAQAAADSYAVNSGDKVEVQASEATDWTSKGGDITLNVSTISGTTWAAKLINRVSTASTLTLEASASAESARNKTVQFVVAGGDARNGSYKVYATNGSRATLDLNFDVGSYALSGSTVDDADASGNFSADPNEPGTYVFASPRIATVANTARFRISGDTMVGAFPFAIVQNSPVTYEVRPFVASRAMEKNRAAFDGIYNRFGITLKSGTSESDISQFEISGGGTVLKRCANQIIYRIGDCPVASILSYTIEAGPTEDTWKMVDGKGALAANFAMAPLDGKHVFLLTGGLLNGAPTERIFRLGVPDSTAWPTGRGYGSATPGSWGRVDVQATTSTRTGVNTGGGSIQTSNTFIPMGSSGGPYGMRGILGTNGEGYFAVNSASLFAIVGANNTDKGTAGYLQLNLMD